MNPTIMRLLTSAVLMMACLAAPLAMAQGEMLNVKEFGAKGDGGVDDTKALQAAFDAQRQPPYKKVYFPPGRYKISDTLTMYGINIYTEGASISQTDPAKDIFYIEFAWGATLKNVTFYGGAVQLNMGNNNVDQGLVRIEDCTFMQSNDTAIKMARDSRSTHLIIRGCKFSDCEQALDTICDMTTLADCWITTRASMTDKAVILNRGANLRCENICGVPHPDAERALNQRWIDNYGWGITCVNFRFGGEGGGFPAVVNWNREAAITLDGCGLYCVQNGRRRGAIFFEEVPASLTVRGCGGGTGNPLIGVSEKIDLDTYFDDKARSYYQPVQIRLDPPFGQGTNLPQQLMPYLLGDMIYEHGPLAPPEGFQAPTKGWWRRGQFVRNPNEDQRWSEAGKTYASPRKPGREEPYGWYCVESGKPGQWIAVYCPAVEAR